MRPVGEQEGQLLPKLSNPMFVGSSLGGYWADRMAQQYGVPVVLINPCTKPAETLPKLGAPLTPKELRAYPRLKPVPGTPRTVLLASDDEVLNWKDAAELYAKVGLVKTTPTGGHRFENVELVYAAIIAMDNTMALPLTD